MLGWSLMSKLLSSGQGRIAFQICAIGAVAALMSGCSADSTRFGDAFGNPFATGSIAKPKPKPVAARKPPVSGTGASAPIVSSALPPHGATAVNAAPIRPAPVAVSHETTGSIGPSHAVPGASFGGWTGEGGASVAVGQGDTAAVLAQRYGVPQNVLLQVNGLHAASDIQPGGHIVVPIYNAVASKPGAAPRVAEAPAPREPAVKSAPAHAAEALPAEPKPFKVAKQDSKAEKAALAEREAATRKAAAQKAAADKVAADKLAAEKVAVAQKAAAAEKLARAEAAAARKVAVKSAPARAERSAETQKMPEAQKAAAADKAAAAQTAAAAARDAAKAKADAVKAAAVAAKAAKVAAATPAPAASAAPAKPEVSPAVEAKKPVDNTPTASVPPASADAGAAGAAGGPEFRWPARGRIIAGFKGGAGGNDGINIAVPDGTPVKAAEGGVVAYAGSELKGYGNLVLIKHPNGYVTAYANNGEIDVKRGETVKRGQTIAKSGQSGNVSSPQLHFELRKGSQPVDPTNYLAGL